MAATLGNMDSTANNSLLDAEPDTAITTADAGQGHHAQCHDWSPHVRAIASLVLIGYLFLLLLGPLTNPVSSEHLTGPLARAVAPAHRALFLGHGYRFFAPEPGPGHFVECRLAMSDGSKESFRFPDRDRHWPRLRYHRWFMLAETLYSELESTPHPDAFAESQTQLRKEADQLQAEGKLTPARRLRSRAQELEIAYEITRGRIEKLIRSVATGMLRGSPDATEVKLVLFERSIPLPIDVVEGAKLTDERYLSEPLPIGQFTRLELLGNEDDGSTVQGRAAAMEELP